MEAKHYQVVDLDTGREMYTAPVHRSMADGLAEHLNSSEGRTRFEVKDLLEEESSTEEPPEDRTIE